MWPQVQALPMQHSGGPAIIAITHARLSLVVALATMILGVAACADLEEPTPDATAPESPPDLTITPEPTPEPTLLPANEPVATASEPLPIVGLDLRMAIFFERGGEIWSFDLPANRSQPIIRGLQSTSPLEPGDPWALAPDGQSLALARNTPGQPAELTLVALPGARWEEIGRYAGRIDSLCWSHDSSRLAFLVTRRDEQTGELLAQNLRLYDTVSRGQASPYQREFQPAETARQGLWLEGWAPGDQALYVLLAMEQSDDPGTLYALQAWGGEPRLVSTDYLLKGGEAICPLTSAVLLRRRAAEMGSGGKASPLYVATAGRDGMLSGVRLLSPADWYVGAVAWSPEGQRVVAERLEAQAHGTFAVHLWLLALDGTAPRQLTADEVYREERPFWMGDGQTIVFDRWQAAQPVPAGLWALGPDGKPRQLDENGARGQAASPLPETAGQ